MRFADRYVDYTTGIIELYKGEMPLAAFLKQYFAINKKFGSKDRKHIGHLCYCYYRLGGALKSISTKDKIKAALFLCNDSIENWQELFNEEWLFAHTHNLQQRIAFVQLQYSFNTKSIFTLRDEISETIDVEAFTVSHLVQPDLFIRLRPGKAQQVLHKLNAETITFTKINETCIALPNNTKLDGIAEINKEVVVQDYSSQRVAELMTASQKLKVKSEKNEDIFASHDSRITSHVPQLKVWDCCAASGGKSILAVDTLGKINLTASDIRTSIIQNMKSRFADAGIRDYTAFVKDLSINEEAEEAKSLKLKAESKEIKINKKNQPDYQLSTTNYQLSKYDLIICDAPCSGSGTWGRTPEQLSFFTKEKINYYTNLQQNIASNVVPHLLPGGHFLYITCSVFKAENEDMVDFIEKKLHLKLVEVQSLIGYDKKADSMFAALFTT